MQKVLLAIVGLVVGIMLLTTILPDTIHDATTDAYSEPFSVGSGVTTTTETLTYDHYYADLTDLAVTSDNVADTPTVLSYDEDTKDTVVIGLDSGESRILTIDYVREAHQEFTGFSGFVRLIPFLGVIGLVVACIWSLFSAVRSR